MNKDSFIPYKILTIVSGLLFIAVAPMPYGYYTFTRIAVCGCAGALCYRLFTNDDKSTWLWIWGTVAILFNPFVVIHMTKGVWMVMDIAVGILFGYAAYVNFKVGKKNSL